jgi:hypothetical protein
MVYGTFHPAETKIITNVFGNKVLSKTPEGYSGLFWGKMSFEMDDGTGDIVEIELKNAQDYFLTLGREFRPDDPYIFWTKIDRSIGRYCEKYIAPYMNNNIAYNYQYGFGGDKCDGLIEYWLPVQIPQMKRWRFKILDTYYIYEWTTPPEDGNYLRELIEKNKKH